MSKRIYRAPESVVDREAMDAIARDDVERLIKLPVDLAFHHENWRFVQDVCVRLSEHRDRWVRVNALWGLSYTANFRRRLEKNVVKPILLRALKDPDPEVSGTARDATNDINSFLGWRIGGAKRQKEIEVRYEKKKRANQPPEPTSGLAPGRGSA